jgi:hypothetical protein
LMVPLRTSESDAFPVAIGVGDDNAVQDTRHEDADIIVLSIKGSCIWPF